jgi:hypothetical protein
LEPTGASAAGSAEHTYAKPAVHLPGPSSAAAAVNTVAVHNRHIISLPNDAVFDDVPGVAVKLSTSEFLTQPLVDTVADAQAAATPVIQVDGSNFCTVCNSFTCDHSCELDFEWTAEDDAALIAGADEDSGGYTSVPSLNEDALLAD